MRKPGIKQVPSGSLKDIIDTAYIIAHQENTKQLEQSLAQEGFQHEVIRSEYTAQQLTYSRAIRCLINHAAAWKKASKKPGFFIIVKADFVPAKGIGTLPPPFHTGQTPDHLGWLYTGGPVAYHIDQYGFVYGHACTTVAFMISHKVARAMLEFYEEEIKSVKGAEYRAWDTYISIKLRWHKGINSCLPFRQYGEHGGIPNEEHRVNNITQWHQAGRLAGPLSFLPAYAKGSYFRYLLIRFRGYARGWYRFLRWKVFEWKPWVQNHQKWALLWWGIKRQI